MKAKKLKRTPKPSGRKIVHGVQLKTGAMFLLNDTLQNIAGHFSAEDRRRLASKFEEQVKELRASADLMDARQILTESGRN